MSRIDDKFIQNVRKDDIINTVERQINALNVTDGSFNKIEWWVEGEIVTDELNDLFDALGYSDKIEAVWKP